MKKGSDPVPRAFGTDFVAVHSEILTNSCVELIQREGKTLDHILGTRRASAEAVTTITKNGFEDIVNVRHIGVVGSISALLETIRTKLIVDLTSIFIGKNIIRFFNLLELQFTK